MFANEGFFCNAASSRQIGLQIAPNLHREVFNYCLVKKYLSILNQRLVPPGTKNIHLEFVKVYSPVDQRN